MPYISKDPLVQNRELKVQELSIPFKITGNATPASVAITCDEPNMMFIKTEGVNQITAALASGETATYSVAPVDANGIFNIFLKLNEPVQKIMCARMVGRDTGLVEVAKLGDADGLSSAQNIMITCDTAKDLSTSAVLDACLVIQYVI